MANAHVVADRGLRQTDFLGWAPIQGLVASFFEGVAHEFPTERIMTMVRAAPASLALAGSALRQRAADSRREAPAVPATALIVGGDCAQQRFCETFLQTVGLAVDVAATAEDGLTAAARSAYALVIVDERTRGFDADLWAQVLGAAASRTGASAPDIYVVVDPEARPNLGECRAIQRPVRAVNLVRAIERLAR